MSSINIISRTSSINLLLRVHQVAEIVTECVVWLGGFLAIDRLVYAAIAAP